MEFTDPYLIDVPAGTRAVGEAPFWSPGELVTWTFRRFDFDRDHAEVRRPMRVIEDGPEGAVLWLPGGAATTDTRIVGWEDTSPHDVPLRARFGPPAEAPLRVSVPGAWRGAGVLKIVPPRVPFSVWVLLRFDEAAGGSGGSDGASETRGASTVRAEWYVNLEAIHRRTAAELFTSDHILDITFPLARSEGASRSTRLRPSEFLRPEGTVFKDVDELAAAASYGMWPAAWSDIIRRNGMAVLENLDDFAWAFDPKWEQVARELAAGVRSPGTTSARTCEEFRGTEGRAERESRTVGSGCYQRDWI